MKSDQTKLKTPFKAAGISSPKGITPAVVEFLRKAKDSGLIDTAIMPVVVPSGDSYAWVLIEEDALFANANALPPIMTVQGGKVLSSLTKHGSPELKVAAVMRPCEIRAAIELAKLNQVDLTNVLLISMDCPGAMPIQDYLSNHEAGEKAFTEAVKSGDREIMRPTCAICNNFAITAPDLHFATIGLSEGEILLIPASKKGEEALETLGIAVDKDTSLWQAEIEKLSTKAEKAKIHAFAAIKASTNGLVNFAKVLSKCISCKNCMSVCPVCYCRRCYYQSDAVELSPEQYLDRASNKGSIRLPQDVLLFHLGRMSHMTMSCVSCGSCEDACPMDIPVAQLFSAVAEDSQALFEYIPGMSVDEPPPLRVFQKDHELCDIERICADPLKGCDCK